ncbi:MAG: asparaginase [Bacteroidota bacterium]
MQTKESEISLLIIYTGGTIGMVQDPQSGALRPFNIENLYKHIPVLEQYPFRIDSVSFDPLVDSSGIQPEFISELAEMIAKNYEDYDGFVVLHGTDTMAYTASFLSFMLENLNKPVILTGAQLPLGVLRSDGRENFINAIEIASMQQDGMPRVPEVAVYFENRLYRGNRTHKSNAEDFEAFSSENHPPLANIGVHIKYFDNYILKPNFKRLKIHKTLDDNIILVKLYPGFSERAFKAMLSIPGLKGVILETYGTGNAPDQPWFLEAIRKACDNGIIILNISQCESGSVVAGKYAASVSLYEAGVIPGYDMTSEAAVAKMMVLLGRKYNTEETKALLMQPMRGELTVPQREKASRSC